MTGQLSLAAALWSFLGRRKEGRIPAWLKNSARRKFSRSQRGKFVLCRTTPGFQMQCRIGDPLDNMIYFDGEFEAELRMSLERLAPALSTVVDVGCNIGYVSCLIAWLTEGRARVLSLDPNPEMISRCEANLKLNGFAAEVSTCAAGRVEEIRAFHVPKHRPSFASFGQLAHDCEKIEVPVQRLDRLVCEKGLDQIDLLKIDVEGFEPEVLGGLGDLRVKNIYLEFSPRNLKQCGFSPDDLWGLPLWKNYRLALIETGTARPIYFEPGAPIGGQTEIVWAQAII
jgi:FkbM family methyltransferase